MQQYLRSRNVLI